MPIWNKYYLVKFVLGLAFTVGLLANQMFWDICSKRPNVLGQDLIKEDNRAKKCFDKSETESEIIVWKGGTTFQSFSSQKSWCWRGLLLF